MFIKSRIIPNLDFLLRFEIKKRDCRIPVNYNSELQQWTTTARAWTTTGTCSLATALLIGQEQKHPVHAHPHFFISVSICLKMVCVSLNVTNKSYLVWFASGNCAFGINLRPLPVVHWVVGAAQGVNHKAHQILTFC